MNRDKLTELLLRDREERAEREHQRNAERYRNRPESSDGIGFDPFMVTRWKVVAGPDPGYLPTTPMRKGAVGFWLACRCCGEQFESKGLAYCVDCMKVPADERRATPPVAPGRLCEGCGEPIPSARRSGLTFCSNACRQQDYRRRQALEANIAAQGLAGAGGERKSVTDNSRRQLDSRGSDSVTDSGNFASSEGCK
jgi:hypothetical protein